METKLANQISEEKSRYPLEYFKWIYWRGFTNFSFCAILSHFCLVTSFPFYNSLLNFSMITDSMTFPGMDNSLVTPLKDHAEDHSISNLTETYKSRLRGKSRERSTEIPLRGQVKGLYVKRCLICFLDCIRGDICWKEQYLWDHLQISWRTWGKGKRMGLAEGLIRLLLLGGKKDK